MQCAQLAACGVIAGDAAAAQLHYTGLKMAVDLKGGLKKMQGMESEAVVFSQVASAWFSRNRPVFHPDEWDPGSWWTYKTNLSEPVEVFASERSPSCPGSVSDE
jgi:hypothetical protein